MSKWGWMIGVLCFLAAAIMLLWSREQTRKTVRKIEKMLDDAMNGSFTETDFDESELSALETKFANYLFASTVSAQNVEAEKERIKTLIADISHQTKTPIANLLLYSELLMEANERGLTLHLEDTDIAACFDGKWTAEALANIVDNAIKYTNQGGVTLSVKSYELSLRNDRLWLRAAC